jgi:hypothetical protein
MVDARELNRSYFGLLHAFPALSLWPFCTFGWFEEPKCYLTRPLPCPGVQLLHVLLVERVLEPVDGVAGHRQHGCVHDVLPLQLGGRLSFSQSCIFALLGAPFRDLQALSHYLKKLIYVFLA